MARPIIPPDRAGYMIVGSEIHTRYATHCPRGIRVRSLDEAFASVARAEYTVCETCYPGEATRKPAATKRRPRRPAQPPRVEGV